jgi:dTDP-4-dehydrorhamnose 3,5-epimerase
MKGKIKIFKSTIFSDKRGFIWSSWKKNSKLKLNFNHDKFAISKKNVLRGFHGDKKTWKLMSCVYGKILLIITNYNEKSKNFLKYKKIILDHKENKNILIPPNFLNATLCLSNNCVLHYKLCYKGKYNGVGQQLSLKWNDKRLKIKWPKRKFLLSKRDE